MAGIICDSREIDIYAYLEDEDVNVSKEALEFGDFLIKVNDEPRILLERKTWEDLAGSISDCRIDEQIEGLVNARDTHGIRVGFIIEGKAFPNPKAKVRKTMYCGLQAKMRHMYIRHGVSYFHTKDHAGTSTFLVDLARDLEKMEGIKNTNLSSGTFGGRRKISQDTQLRDMWSKFPSISKRNAHVIGANISLKDLLSTNEDDIAAMTYDSGNKIGNKKAKSILKGKDNQLLILSSIPGLSKKSAEILLQTNTLDELLNMDARAWQAIGKEKGLRIGQVTSEKIVNFINSKISI